MMPPDPVEPPAWIADHFGGSPLGVVVCDRHERVVFVNAAQERNSSLRATELIGKPMRQVYGRAIEQFEDEYRALIERAEPFRRTFRNYRRTVDGSVVSFTLAGYRIGDWAVFTTLVEDELREETERAEALAAEVGVVRSLLELADLLVGPTRPANVIESFVAIAPRMIRAGRASISLWSEVYSRHEPAAQFGMSPEEAGAFARYPLDAEPIVGKLREMGSEILLEDVSRSALCTPGLARVFGVHSLLVVPLRWRDTYLGFLAIDRKEFEPRDVELVRGAARLLSAALANTRLIEEARQGSRLKSAFLANVSHELRTPLNVILGYTSLVEDHLADLGDQSQQELFDAIHRASRRLLRTIHTILDFSRLESGSYAIDPQPLVLGRILSEVVQDAKPEAVRKGIELRLTVDRPQSTVTFDEPCLRELVTQLLDNAVKFTERGEVEVRVDGDESGPRSISVRDTGIGIDSTYLPQLFEPFSQEDPSATRRYEGTGLGLALARKLAERNEAMIEVETAKGKGSCFRLVFPRETMPPRVAA